MAGFETVRHDLSPGPTPETKHKLPLLEVLDGKPKYCQECLERDSAAGDQRSDPTLEHTTPRALVNGQSICLDHESDLRKYQSYCESCKRTTTHHLELDPHGHANAKCTQCRTWQCSVEKASKPN